MSKEWEARLPEISASLEAHETDHHRHDKSVGDEYEGPLPGIEDWFATMTLEDGQKPQESECGHVEKGPAMSFIDEDVVALYRCSYCRNPSASLKKCSGCGKVRYCNVNW